MIKINYITNKEGNKRRYFTTQHIKELYGWGFNDPNYWRVPYWKQYMFYGWWYETYLHEIHVEKGKEEWQQVKQEKRLSYLYDEWITKEIGRISFKKLKIKKLKGLSIARPDSEIFEEY